jgi:hypothetical protein
LHSDGERGWELCGTFPDGQKGAKRAIPGKAEPRGYGEAAEAITLIFKRA